MKKAVLLLIIIALFSCNEEQKLKNTNGLFSKIEFQELNLLLHDFDSILIEEYNTSSIKNAYSEFSKYVLKNNTIPSNSKIDSLGKSVIKYNVFDKIWWSYKSSNSDKLKYNLASQSNYLKYLKLIGEQFDFIKEYTNIIESTSDITPSLAFGFAKNIQLNDFENENIRLIFAIHYLTLLNR